MQEIDRLFFDKYAIDSDSEVFITNGLTDGCNEGLDYDDFYENGLDEEAWPELD
jgi:hypothetical protein